MADRNADMARRIAAAVADAGGRTYYVGGYVRDLLLGLENKDIDIEVHGVTVPSLAAILDGLGERTAMGASFGVMGLRHYDIDIAMPRSERATGRGHRDFEVIVDPFIGEKKAALRRDFTMNALMQDVLTGEILDFFGGRADLAARRIRHVNDASFAEDPLRVFRAAQFAARFGFAVADETTAICAGMDVDALAPERVMGELEKALLKAARPSSFFTELKRMGQLCPWFAALEALPGAAWERVMAMLDAAAVQRPEATEPLGFMLAAACAGFAPDTARGFLARLTNAVELTRYVINMVQRFGDVEGYLSQDPGEAGWMALFDGALCPEDLLLLTRAAHAGEPGWPDAQRRLDGLYALYRERMDRPYVMGRDLMAAGVGSGPEMGRALAYAHGLRLAGADKAGQLQGTLEWLEWGKDGHA
jgi:tRNA nucleotidyltransferase (CCA-adding enzyme)